MKFALAIKSCQKYLDRQQACVDTWLKYVDEDFFFVVGGPQTANLDTLHVLGASDAFQDIAPKVWTACVAALNDNVTNLVITDDDTYLCWPRLLKSGFEKFDYLGFVRNYDTPPYMQGSCFCLSERAMDIILKNKRYMVNGVPDDVATGRCLYGQIPFTHEHRFAIGEPYPSRLRWPQASNDIIAAHKIRLPDMQQCHALVTAEG